MVDRNSVNAAVYLLAQVSCGLLAERNYRRLPVVSPGGSASEPSVSIIIPARDEARRISPLLDSLTALHYSNYEVILVDDDSSDETAALARAAGARVIHVERLPAGWTGKSYACRQGANATTGEWLLFTDADTIHKPASLSTALALAEKEGADLVSFLCRQQCVTFWERLLLPYAYALYFVGRANINTTTRSAVANGQYLLVKRAAYERFGGHDAVRTSLVEDVALAQRARRSGMRVVLADGASLVDVRMYDGLASLWEGFTKNSFRFVVAAPVSGAMTVLASTIYASALPRAMRSRSAGQGAALYTLPALYLMPWCRRFGVPIVFSFLYPLAALIFGLISLDSIRRSVRPGATVWKDRRY